MDFNYLMTSDFNENITPQQYIELLLRFRYEYRVLHSKTSSYINEIETLKIEKENLSKLLFELDNKLSKKIALMEDELHFMKNDIKKKLTWKERFLGKIN